MKPDFPPYLEGPQAIEDIRDVLSQQAEIRISEDFTPGRFMWCVHKIGAWNRVGLRNGWGAEHELVACFRKQGEGYVLTDAGGAWWAHCERTGDLNNLEHACWEHFGAVLACLRGWPTDFKWKDNALTLANISPADLPRAICALLLAVYRVAELEASR